MRKQFLLFVLLSLAPLLNLVKSRLPRIYRGCLLSGLPCSRALLFLLSLAPLLLCSPAVVLSQQRWTRTYGGPSNDYGSSVQQTQDGGYIVAGTYDIYGANPQVYLVKTNASGDTLWTRNYGGASNEEGWSVRQTSDGGYVVAGYTGSFGNGWQVYLIKTNASGDTLWTRIYGGAASEECYSVQQTQDSGYVIAGNTASFGNQSQVYLIKTNSSGDTLWTRTYGGTNNDMGYSVQQTSDAGYIVAGEASSFGNGRQVYLVKTNATGDTLWTRTYGGASTDFGYSVQQTQDSGYVIAGSTTSFGNGYQVYLVKTNATGDTLWTKTYGGMSDDPGKSVQQTTDGGYIIAGYTNSFGNGEQVYLIKTNVSGDTLWTKTYGGPSNDYGSSVQQTQDGGYIVAGTYDIYGANPQVYLIKTDANGNVGVADNGSSRLTPYASRLTVSPNPFTSFATLPGYEAERFNLYNISGRQVGMYKGDRIGEGLSPGVYFIRPLNRDSRPVRIVKVR